MDGIESGPERARPGAAEPRGWRSGLNYRWAEERFPLNARSSAQGSDFAGAEGTGGGRKKQEAVRNLPPRGRIGDIL
jgi:hypothetical protein